MQCLAQYPSCPDDCMMWWQYLGKQSCSRCWLLIWTTDEVYYVRDGFYWWLCQSMRRPASTSVWMALPCFTSWVSIAHMRMWGFLRVCLAAASKERNKIGILNLFLPVSWTTMSYYFSKCGFSLWQWFWSMVSMMYELASRWIICWRRGVRVRGTCFWTSSCSWSLLRSIELSCDGFSQCGFILNNWLGNEFLRLYFTDGRRSLFGSLAIQWWYLMLTVIGLRGVFEYAVR